MPGAAARVGVYRRRRPECTVLYEAVRQELETWLARSREADPDGDPIPWWVEEEFRRFLACGILAQGFARARCAACGHDFLVAFSCKGRGVCPSCNTRRMAETAAHLVDHVFPRVPVRQWVVSFPKRLRYFLHRDPALLGRVLAVVLRALEGRLRACCAGAPATARFGAVTFIQRFGSALNAHLHFHICVIDGVFSQGADGALRFHPAAGLDGAAVAAVAGLVRQRVLRLYERSGRLDAGCGKSTLLRMIAGLETITSGTLEIEGQVVNDVPPAQRGIAMVFQSYGLYPHMNVHKNMSFALELAKKSRQVINTTVTQAARMLQMEPYLERLPKALSGGQRQRVAIGRAIVRDPKVYLFDEPLSNLDAALRVATRIEIAQLKESMPESTMIYVTHDQVEAMTLASRIVLLTPGGRIAQVGKPLELYTRPQNEFVAQFIGSPAMNLLPGEVVGTGEQTTIKLDTGGVAVSAAPTRSSEEGLKVNAGVRPEDLVETDGDYIFEGKVSITEELGDVTLLHFDRVQDKDTVLARLPGIHPGLRGNSVKLTAEPPKIHVFHEGVSLYYR